MTRAQGRALRARWRGVEAAQRRELRRTSLDQRVRQLAALMASAPALGGRAALAAEDAAARRRWVALQRAVRGRA